MDSQALPLPGSNYPRVSKPALRAPFLPREYFGVAVIAGYVLLTLCLILFGGANILRLAFPALALAISFYLYRNFPIHYVSFVLWLWFLSPFVRRLIDYRSVWVDPSPVLLAPHLASVVAVFSLFRTSGLLRFKYFLPFLMALAGVAYGTGIGLLRIDVYHVGISLLSWVTPLFLGWHICSQWRRYPEYRNVLKMTCLWGVIIMGGYGVFQFLVAPAWDNFWIINVRVGTFGAPEPMRIRVFSTMNAPGALAPWLMAGLLLLFSNRKVFAVPAAAVGFCSFMLGQERTAWIGWAVGIAVILLLANSRTRVRIVSSICVMALFVLPLATLDMFSDTITARLQSFNNGKDDISYVARYEGHKRFFVDALASPLGKGVGAMDKEYAIDMESEAMGPHDSAFVEIILSLGWFGASLYLGSIALTALWMLQRRRGDDDMFDLLSRAVVLGMVVQFPLGSVMVAPSGIILWCFAGAAMAADRYHREQRILEAAEAL